MPQNIDVHKEFASFFDDENTQAAAYAVSKKLADGHTCVDIEKYNTELLNENTKDEVGTTNMGTINYDHLTQSKWISQGDDIQPFVIANKKLYLQRYYSYETEVIEQIFRLIETESLERTAREEALNKHKDFILDLFTDHKPDKNNTPEENMNWQLSAAITSALSNFSIITGGPGTGKTTAVAKLLAILYTTNTNLRVALAAPTGKAAARMKESLMNAVIWQENDDPKLIRELNDTMKSFDKLNATTIHRLLGYQFGTHYFKHDANNPLDFDVVIIDESSMIGASMMAKLLQAIKPSARVIMLGDKDQLASVEAGSIFGDICLTQKQCMNKVSAHRGKLINRFINNPEAQLSSDFIANENLSNPLQEHITELKKSWRFKSSEGIGEFSHAVISSKIPAELLTRPKPESGEFVTVCSDYNLAELHELMDYYEAYILEEDIVSALKKMNNIRFLCAVRQGEYGVNHYNEYIANYLKSKKLITPNDSFYENQPIMITQNDKEQNLFNGDIGLIRMDKTKQKYMAYFEDPESDKKYRAIPTTYLSVFTTVFAMTIHKSQGSEFKHVGIILPNKESAPLLTRELIYTAITRAKKSAIIFSSHEVLINGSAKQVERASGITERIINPSN